MEVDIIKAIQSIYVSGTWWGDILDNIVLCLTFLGESSLILIVLFALYWCFDKKAGEYLLFCVFCSSGLNFTLKNVFKRPRPIYAENGVTRHLKVDNLLVDTAYKPTSYSFPSGHAMIGGSLYQGFASYYRKKSLIIICTIITVIIALTRLYIGVHYPSDVLVGMLLAFLICWLLGKVFISFYDKKYIIYFIAVLVFTACAIILGTSDLWRLVGAGLSFCIFAPLEEEYIGFDTKGVSGVKKALRFLLGAVVVGALYFVFSLILTDSVFCKALSMFIMVFGASFLAPLVFKKLKL